MSEGGANSSPGQFLQPAATPTGGRRVCKPPNLPLVGSIFVLSSYLKWVEVVLTLFGVDINMFCRGMEKFHFGCEIAFTSYVAFLSIDM